MVEFLTEDKKQDERWIHFKSPEVLVLITTKWLKRISSTPNFFLDGTFQCSSSSYAQLGCSLKITKIMIFLWIKCPQLTDRDYLKMRNPSIWLVDTFLIWRMKMACPAIQGVDWVLVFRVVFYHSNGQDLSNEGR